VEGIEAEWERRDLALQNGRDRLEVAVGFANH
jgi:hypothetical protein